MVAAAAAIPPVVTVKRAVASIVGPPSGEDEVEVDLAETTVIEIAPEAGDSNSPQWPDAAAEAVFLSEQRSSGETIVPSAPTASRIGGLETEQAEVANPPLPPLQTLVDRIPADARETLDELFRARFVLVKRVQTASLK